MILSLGTITLRLTIEQGFTDKPQLQEVIAQTRRKKYGQYGMEEESLDDYDKKAFQILVEIHHVEHNVSQYFSMRCIPGSGQPLGSEDFLLTTTEHSSVQELLAKKQNCDTDEIWSQVATFSRICGVNTICECHQESLTVLCFAFAVREFIKQHGEFKYFTGLFRDAHLNAWFSRHTDIPWNTVFMSTKTVLGSSTHLMRRPTLFQYPSYFFDTHSLKKVLSEMYNNNDLTDATFQKYFGKSWSDMNNSYLFQHLGTLLSVDGEIIGSPLTGVELRTIIFSRVSRVPQLRIATRDVLLQLMNRVIESYTTIKP